MILSKSLNLIGSQGNVKGKFSNNIKKIFFSETIKGMKLKLGTRAKDICLYIDWFFIPVGLELWLLW